MSTHSNPLSRFTPHRIHLLSQPKVELTNNQLLLLGILPTLSSCVHYVILHSSRILPAIPQRDELGNEATLLPILSNIMLNTDMM